MKKWVSIEKELPPLNKEIKIKVIDGSIYSFSTGKPYREVNIGIKKGQLVKKILNFIPDWEDAYGWNVGEHYIESYMGDGPWWIMKLNQISHWEKETFRPIKTRFEILDL